MGLFDSVTSAVNRGTESAGRAAEKVKINNKLNEITKRRQQLTSQLGASLYLATKDDPAMREGREGLYNAIATCDLEREQCQQRLGQLELMNEAVESFRCVVCGAKMTGSDLFCSGCGTTADQARPAMAAPMGGAAVGTTRCASCGAPMGANDIFCMSCGASVAPAASAGSAPAAGDTKCASCGAPMAADDMFCMSCGARVGADQVVVSESIEESETVDTTDQPVTGDDTSKDASASESSESNE